MAATHVLKAGPTYPAGISVSVYENLGEVRRDAPPTSPEVTYAVVSDDSIVTFTDLAYETAYWAVAQVDNSWRWVGFRTGEAPAGGGSGVVVTIAGDPGPLPVMGQVWLEVNVHSMALYVGAEGEILVS